MPTGAQIENQIIANYDAMNRIIEKSHAGKHTMAEQVRMQKEVDRLWQAQIYWAGEYKKATGREWILVKPMVIVVNLKEEKAEADRKAATKKAQDEAESKVREYLEETRREYTRIIALLKDQYDISVTWQNALFSHWVRIGGGTSSDVSPDRAKADHGQGSGTSRASREVD